MGRIRGERGEGTSRLRRRRRLLAGSALAALAVFAGTVATGPASAEDEDFGAIQWEIWSGWSYDLEYGQSLELYGSLSDLSQSCLTFPLDCDRPTGTLTFSGADHTIDYGSTGMTFSGGDPRASFAVWEHTIPAEKFFPGTQYVVIDYAGNFDETTTYVEVRVTRQACRSFSVYADRYGSKPGQPVTLTADLGSVGHTGTLAIYDQAGGLIGTGAPTDGRSFSTTTSALPQGENWFYATYSGDRYYEGCTSPYGLTTVSADANPTARDDTVSTTVGTPVAIDVLANDSDDNPGIRSEIADDPDFGDFEKIGDTYWYTPDPDMGNYQDSFDYFLYDSIGQSSAEAHVVINVGCTPYAANDRYGTRAYSQLVVTPESGTGVQRNDAACDQTVSLASTTTHGTLDFESDGSFSYTPEAGFTGTDSFTYEYTDLLETPVTGKAEIQVTPLLANPSPLPPLETTTTTTSTTTTTQPTTSTTSTTQPTTTTTTEATTTTTTRPPTTGEATAAELYQLLLGRAPDPSGQAFWAQRLDRSDAATVARQLIDSAEWRRRFVAVTYTLVLGRPVDPAGSASWTARLDRDPPSSLRVGLLASNELWTRVGSDPSAWTDRAYQALLGRDATPDEHRVIDGAVTDGASRRYLAATITGFDGAHRWVAQLWHTSLLDRSATGPEREGWAAAAAAGRSERWLVAQLAARSANS